MSWGRRALRALSLAHALPVKPRHVTLASALSRPQVQAVVRAYMEAGEAACTDCGVFSAWAIYRLREQPLWVVYVGKGKFWEAMILAAEVRCDVVTGELKPLSPGEP